MKRISIEGKENAHLFRYSEKGVIYFRMFRARKGQIERSTGTTKINEARKKADQFKEELFSIKSKPKIRKLVCDFWGEFARTKTDKSKATQLSGEYASKRLLPFFGQCFPSEVTPGLWEQYIVFRRSSHASAKFFDDWKWMGQFLRYLKTHGHLDNTPKLRNPDCKLKKVGKVFSKEEVRRLLNYANDELGLQILMAYTMGMRVGEILNLNWDRIDLEKKTIRLRAEDTKIRRARTFGISKEVYKLLSGQKEKSGPLFASPKNLDKSVGRGGNKTAWTNCRKLAKVRGRFHDLRHTFLTNAFRNANGKIDSMLICEYAGLSIEMAQATYLHFDEEDTRPVCDLVTL